MMTWSMRCFGDGSFGLHAMERVVQALGGYGEYVEKISDIKPALARAFASGLPACVNVEVDPKAVSMVTTWLYDSLVGPKQ